MKKSISLFAFLLVGLLVYGQDFARDMASINHTYFTLKKRIDVTATLTSDGESSTSSYTAYMDGIDHYFMKSESTEMLVDSTTKVVMNKAMNAVMIDSNRKNSVEELPIQMFDTMSNLYASIKYTDLVNGYGRYELYPMISEIDKIIIEFSTTSKLVRSMKLMSFTGEGEATAMSLTYNYGVLRNSDIPKVSKYLWFDASGKAQLTAAYASYELINYLNR